MSVNILMAIVFLAGPAIHAGIISMLIPMLQKQELKLESVAWIVAVSSYAIGFLDRGITEALLTLLQEAK